MYYDLTVTQFSKMLGNFNSIFDKAVAFAEAKKIEPDILLHSRLAPDQFHFIRQIQMMCDTAKFSVARLTGIDAPSHPDSEVTLSELKSRIQSVFTFLESVKRQDFDNAAEQKVSQPRWEGKWMTGHDYLIQHVIPNFYFHITTAYAILRHNGVDVGKRDYLGTMPYK